MADGDFRPGVFDCRACFIGGGGGDTCFLSLSFVELMPFLDFFAVGVVLALLAVFGVTIEFVGGSGRLLTSISDRASGISGTSANDTKLDSRELDPGAVWGFRTGG